MMNARTILRAALLVPLLAGAPACVELGLEPQANVSNDAYLQSIGDFRAAINGVYDQLSIPDYYGRSLHLMSDIMGEDVKQNSSANRYQEFSDFEGLVVTGHDYETELWAEAYEAVNMLNRMVNSDFEPPSGVRAEFDHIIGQAYALRGLVYFDLVKMYAQHYTFTAGGSHPGVPLVLTSDVTALPSRASVGAVFDQILSDFGQGIGMMDATPASPYVMTRLGARALLSRIHLYMESWGEAVTEADAVINSGEYSLETGTAYINQFVDGGSSEAIFEMIYTESDENGSDCLGCMYAAYGYGDYLPAHDLLDLMDPADIRNQWFVTDSLLTGQYASQRVDKWPSRSQQDNIPVIRLSEVYLNRAEANYHLGNTAEAQADLNTIRQRANPSAPDVTATGPALLDEILIERRIELGYEGHRIHDLMRYQMDIDRVDYTGDVAFMAYPCEFCILPIPADETNANSNIAQNAGY